MYRSLLLGLLGVTVVVAIGCTDSTPKRSPTPSPAVAGAPTAGVSVAAPADAIAASVATFEAAMSYRTRFAIEAPGIGGKIDGVAAFRAGDALYARTTLIASPTGEHAGERLFLPPDLYLQEGADSQWYVQSPWNQGAKPGQPDPPYIGLAAPIVLYGTFAAALQNVKERDRETIDGRELRRFEGRIKFADIPLLAPGSGSGSATALLWLDPSTGLPARIELRATGDFEFHASVDYSGYGAEAAAPPPPADARPFRDAVFPGAPCIGAELADCLAAQPDIAGSGSCAGTERRVCLLPLGRISPDLIDHLVATYRDHYGLAVAVLPPAAIPADMEEPKRQQIDASRLITYMGTLYPAAYRDPQAVLIGITPVDLYDSTSHFRYLFGLKGTPADPKAVVSPLRMDPQFYSKPADGLLYYSRVRKLVSKYVGLLYFELPSSSTRGSPMYDHILGPSDVDEMTEPLPVKGAR